MRYLMLFFVVFFSVNIFAGIRDQKLTVVGTIMSYDDNQIILSVGKKKTTIPRLQEFDRKLRFTGKQNFVIDAEKYSDFLLKNRKDK